MKAVYIKGFGASGNLDFREVPDPPKPQATQVLVRVKAAGLNRADLLQRRGLYAPPPGVSPNIPGLEFTGEVVETGVDVSQFTAGDRVFGITAGEAQAQYLLTDESVLATIPYNLSFAEAAAIPEAFITANDAIFTLGNLQPGESILIHAVGSGVGLAALQLAKAKGCRVFGTSRTQDKLDKCAEFSLDVPIVAEKDVNFSELIKEQTSGAGVNVILDLVGAAYFQENLASLAIKGRLILVGLTSGAVAEFNLGIALHKRLTIIGTVLRGRPLEQKADAVGRFVEDVLPLLESGAVKPNLDRVFQAEDVNSAYDYLESNASFGKVVLKF